MLPLGRAGTGLFALLLAAGGCGAGSEPAAEPIHLWHLALPGRPASDAMDRATFHDRVVERALAPFVLHRITDGRAPSAVRAHVRGLGTVALRGDAVVGVLEGAASPRAFTCFLRAVARRAERIVDLRRKLEHASEPRTLLVLAEHLAAVGLADEAVARCAAARAAWRDAGIAPDPRAEELALDLLLRRGRVAEARAALEDARGTGLAHFGCLEARLLLLERRPREALTVLAGARAGAPGERAFLLGLAHLEIGDAPAAHRAFRVALEEGGDSEWAIRAADELAAAVHGESGHVHGPPPDGR